MGVGGSKCCKDLCSTEEVKPLVDPETGRVPRAGTSGRRDGKDEVKGGEGPNRDGPVEPDPAVFYARPVSKARSQRRLVNNDTARETASDRRETRARKHHHRSNQKVGEETVLRFHQENPAKAPIVASSSEDDIGSKPPSEVKGQDEVHVHVSPAPSSAEKDGGKNWIGVCDAKLQHRVWWWSITFVLFFVIGMGVFLGLAHGYQPDHEDHPTSPLYPKVAVLDEESRHDTAVRRHHHHEAPAATHAPGPDVSTQMLSEWESMDRMWSDGADAAWKGGGGRRRRHSGVVEGVAGEAAGAFAKVDAGEVETNAADAGDGGEEIGFAPRGPGAEGGPERGGVQTAPQGDRERRHRRA